MKKIMILGIAFLGMTAISCKKDWTCECSYSANGTSYSENYTLSDMTESDAETACNNNETSVGSYTWSCELQ